MRTPILLLAAALALPARADDDLDAAKKVVGEYLKAVKDAAPKPAAKGKKAAAVDEKKYAAAKKLTAPRTLADLDAMQKRNKTQRHS